MELCKIKKKYLALCAGYATVATRPFQTDDEKLGTLEQKHAKVYQSQDASGIGFSYSTNLEGY